MVVVRRRLSFNRHWPISRHARVLQCLSDRDNVVLRKPQRKKMLAEPDVVIGLNTSQSIAIPLSRKIMTRGFGPCWRCDLQYHSLAVLIPGKETFLVSPLLRASIRAAISQSPAALWLIVSKDVVVVSSEEVP